tara:strand:+ start:270 stop:1397 length:1128 start_codon:yes stop_codon:yes gene_type:complete
MAAVAALLLPVGAPTPTNTDPLYTLDPSWPIGMPKLARQFSAVAVDHTVAGKEIHVIQRGPDMSAPVLVFNEGGELLRWWGNASCSFANKTWGSHGINIQFPPDGAAPKLWVFDFFAGKVLLHSPLGELLDTAGSKQGTGVAPLQYGNVADGDFGPDGLVVITDGDGGVNNRVVALDTTKPLNSAAALLWISGNAEGSPKASGDPKFSGPHSVAYHKPSGTVIVADRGHARLVFLDPKSGKQVGEWACFAGEQALAGSPYGVRTISTQQDDLVLIAAADFPFAPATHADWPQHQYLHIIDAAKMFGPNSGACEAVQSIRTDTSQCVTPHELGVDASNGDIYVACVGANATLGNPQGLQRYRRGKGPKAAATVEEA